MKIIRPLGRNPDTSQELIRFTRVAKPFNEFRLCHGSKRVIATDEPVPPMKMSVKNQ